ncbi:P2X purinoceptor 7-like [Xenopus laevis]|uniref:P2X purinoceptor 7-like n=1 Tax=Xenopus laevis TaxID=8355 RepID=A0A8J1MYT4_XENLA|nr:P2X purinoceptor 7-like [Xenopus laevis]
MRNRNMVVQASGCFPLNPSKNKKRKYIENVQPEESSEDSSTEDDSSEDEVKAENSDENIGFKVDPKRIGNSNWCRCGMCAPMKTGIESLCCYDIDEMYEKVPEDAFCITDNIEFRNECISFERQDWNYRMSNLRIRQQPRWPDYMRSLRRLAYRAYIVWIYIFLGFQNRKPIPSCVVREIRGTFPDPQGNYVGFLFPSDFVAGDMAYESE